MLRVTLWSDGRRSPAAPVTGCYISLTSPHPDKPDGLKTVHMFLCAVGVAATIPHPVKYAVQKNLLPGWENHRTQDNQKVGFVTW